MNLTAPSTAEVSCSMNTWKFGCCVADQCTRGTCYDALCFTYLLTWRKGVSRMFHLGRDRRNKGR